MPAPPRLISLSSNAILIAAEEVRTSGDTYVGDLQQLLNQIPITLVNEIYLSAIVGYFNAITGNELSIEGKYSAAYLAFLNNARIVLKHDHEASTCRYNTSGASCLCIEMPLLIYDRPQNFVNVVSLGRMVIQHRYFHRMLVRDLQRRCIIHQISHEKCSHGLKYVQSIISYIDGI